MSDELVEPQPQTTPATEGASGLAAPSPGLGDPLGDPLGSPLADPLAPGGFVRPPDEPATPSGTPDSPREPVRLQMPTPSTETPAAPEVPARPRRRMRLVDRERAQEPMLQDLRERIGIRGTPQWNQPLDADFLAPGPDPDGDAVVQMAALRLDPEVVLALRRALGLRPRGGVLDRELVRSLRAHQGPAGTGVIDEATFLDLDPGRYTLRGSRRGEALRHHRHAEPWSSFDADQVAAFADRLAPALHGEAGDVRPPPRRQRGARVSLGFVCRVATWQLWNRVPPSQADGKLTASDLRELGLTVPNVDLDALAAAESGDETDPEVVAEATPTTEDPATAAAATPEAPAETPELSEEEQAAQHRTAMLSATRQEVRNFFRARRSAMSEAARGVARGERREARVAAREQVQAQWEPQLQRMHDDLYELFGVDEPALNQVWSNWDRCRPHFRWVLLDRAVSDLLDRPEASDGDAEEGRPREDARMVYVHSRGRIEQPVDATVAEADATLESEGLLMAREELVRTGWNRRLRTAGRAQFGSVSDLASQAISGMEDLQPRVDASLGALQTAINAERNAEGEAHELAVDRLLQAVHHAMALPRQMPTTIRRQIRVRFPTGELPDASEIGQLRRLAVQWRNTLRNLSRTLTTETRRHQAYTEEEHTARNPNAVIVDLNRTGVDVCWNTGSNVPLTEMHLDPVFALAMVRFLQAIKALGVRRIYTSGFLRNAMSPADTHPYGQACDITGFVVGTELIHLRSGGPVEPPPGRDATSEDPAERWDLQSGEYNDLRSGHSDWFDERQTTASRTHREIMTGIAALMPAYFARIIGPGHNAAHMGHFHVELYGNEQSGPALRALVGYADLESQDFVRARADRRDPAWRDGGDSPPPCRHGGLTRSVRLHPDPARRGPSTHVERDLVGRVPVLHLQRDRAAPEHVGPVRDLAPHGVRRVGDGHDAVEHEHPQQQGLHHQDHRQRSFGHRDLQSPRVPRGPSAHTDTAGRPLPTRHGRR